MAYGARLESVLGESPRGFESPILRHAVSRRIDRSPALIGEFESVLFRTSNGSCAGLRRQAVSSHMSGTYAPEMSTYPATVPRPPNPTADVSDDRHRSETFWAAFAAGAASRTRWLDSATAAWRPAAPADGSAD